MASLGKVVESLNLKLSEDKKIHVELEPNNQEQKVGRKRRAWLVEETEEYSKETLKGVDTPLSEKGFINEFHKPYSSTRFINPVDQSLSDKGFIKEGYTPLNLSLEKLRGNPLKIAQFIFELSSHEESQITKTVTQTEIMNCLKITKDSARTAIRFLLKNELIKRVDFKIGKAGWSKYCLKKELFIELDNAYQKGVINPINVSAYTQEQKGSNNSSIINKTIINNSPLLWEEVDVSSLAEIGFTQKHLLQLQKITSPEVVQESINHFIYGLKFNHKTQKYADPLSVLIGVLRKGGVWIESNYKSPQELALEEVLRQKQEHAERLAKLKEDAYKVAFLAWETQLTKEEIEKIAPEKIPGEAFLVPQKVRLSQFFKENIWPKKMPEYLG